MKKKTRFVAYGALIGAMYVILTYLQNIIFPDSATFAIQCRLSEVLCVLAFFTPAAIPGLTVGCLIFNLTYAGALPLDPLVGSLATLFATAAMWKTRNITVRGIPVLGLLMPALFNAIFVGWELTVYIGNTFFLNALFVSLGELIVLLIPGPILYQLIRKRRLDVRFFS